MIFLKRLGRAGKRTGSFARVISKALAATGGLHQRISYDDQGRRNEREETDMKMGSFKSGTEGVSH